MYMLLCSLMVLVVCSFSVSVAVVVSVFGFRVLRGCREKYSKRNGFSHLQLVHLLFGYVSVVSFFMLVVFSCSFRVRRVCCRCCFNLFVVVLLSVL